MKYAIAMLGALLALLVVLAYMCYADENVYIRNTPQTYGGARQEDIEEARERIEDSFSGRVLHQTAADWQRSLFAPTTVTYTYNNYNPLTGIRTHYTKETLEWR